MKVKLFDMPLGSRFRYDNGATRVYILIDYADNGKICDAPIGHERNQNRVQGLYSAAESMQEFREMMVEFVPVAEVRS
jgi:hypothetical protein